MLLRALVLAGVVSQPMAVDLTPLVESWGWVAAGRPLAVEIDGDLTTLEWIIPRAFTDERRVVAERDGRVCVSESFTIDPEWRIERIGVVHRLVWYAWPEYRIEPIPTPVCPE